MMVVRVKAPVWLLCVFTLILLGVGWRYTAENWCASLEVRTGGLLISGYGFPTDFYAWMLWLEGQATVMWRWQGVFWGPQVGFSPMRHLSFVLRCLALPRYFFNQGHRTHHYISYGVQFRSVDVTIYLEIFRCLTEIRRGLSEFMAHTFAITRALLFAVVTVEAELAEVDHLLPAARSTRTPHSATSYCVRHSPHNVGMPTYRCSPQK